MHVVCMCTRREKLWKYIIKCVTVRNVYEMLHLVLLYVHIWALNCTQFPDIVRQYLKKHSHMILYCASECVRVRTVSGMCSALLPLKSSQNPENDIQATEFYNNLRSGEASGFSEIRR